MKKDQEDFYVPRQTKMIEIAEFFADEKALQEGFKKGSKKWEKVKKEFLDEALYDSILPHNTVYGKKAMNPSMSKDLQSLLSDKLPEKRLLGIVTQLTNAYFTNILKIDMKVYRAYFKNANENQKKQMYINRYKYDLMTTIIGTAILKIYETTNKDLEMVMNKIEAYNSTTKELQDQKKNYTEKIYTYYKDKFLNLDLFKMFRN